MWDRYNYNKKLIELHVSLTSNSKSKNVMYIYFTYHKDRIPIVYRLHWHRCYPKSYLYRLSPILLQYKFVQHHNNKYHHTDEYLQ